MLKFLCHPVLIEILILFYISSQTFLVLPVKITSPSKYVLCTHGLHFFCSISLSISIKLCYIHVLLESNCSWSAISYTNLYHILNVLIIFSNSIFFAELKELNTTEELTLLRRILCHVKII